MLSILIPTYNYNVLPLVQELERQARAGGIPFEIIVVEDASTDESALAENSRVATIPHTHYFRNGANLGRTLTRKILAEKAAYDTLLFLDADVMPAGPGFIRNYLPYIGKEAIVLGGVVYTPENPGRDKALRYKYGRYREERPASERNRNPFGAVLSANMLISRQVFLDNNFAGGENFYGMDIYFSYSLFRKGVAVKHIDNPVLHLGLEDNIVFFEKALRAVESRKQLLECAEGIENINNLLRHYKKLRKYRLTGLVALGFGIAEPLLKKMILKNNPSLFCLDMYRLGYICSLK